MIKWGKGNHCSGRSEGKEKERIMRKKEHMKANID